MDIIQRTVGLFSRLLQSIKTIGALLTYNYLPSSSALDEKGKGLFWIFDW